MRLLAALLFAFIVSLSLSAAGQADEADKATARTLFQEAGEAMRAKDYAKAADLYGRANALYPAPTSALGEARALVKIGKLVKASERYQALINTELTANASAAFKQALEDARAERAVVLSRLPALVIRRPGGGRVSLDGHPLDPAALGVKRWVDPGRHRVTAHMPGGKDHVRKVTIAEGQVLELDLPPAPTSGAKEGAPTSPTEAEPSEELADTETGSGSAQRVAGFALIGLGGASLVVGVITGAIYLDAKSTIDEQCDEQQQCSQEGLDAVDRGETVGIVNAVTLSAGVVLATAGVAFVLTAPDEAEEVALRPLLAPTVVGLGVAARF